MDHTEWEQGSSLLLDLVVCKKKKKKKDSWCLCFGLVTIENQKISFHTIIYGEPSI